MATKKVQKKVQKKLKKKPVLSARDKATLRRIMKTVRNIKIWNSQHSKS